jgi:uncharacterized protein YgiM (DUF1202 family)
MKRLRTVLLSALIGFIFGIPVAELQAARPGTTAYTKDAIGLRDKPRPTARVIGTLAARVRVRVNSCSEGWCKVSTQGLTGYVMEDLLVRRTAPPPAGQAER